MKILSIETSCDETAISIVEASGGLNSPSFAVLGNALFSQVQNHKEFGGVYPMLAKRKHGQNFTSLLKKALIESNMFLKQKNNIAPWTEIEHALEKENGLFDEFKNVLEDVGKPDIDLIAVTSGPGLAPALWVGISCAKALSLLWNIPVIPVNHMEGHILSVTIENPDNRKIEFPALALLISGGHTELVKIDGFGKYKIIGETQDDAVGEAFDKVARMLGLPYPGGPEISKLAEYAREHNLPHVAKLPRPMIKSGDLNFSFSGLKTAVLYYIRDKFNIDVLNQSATSRGLGVSDGQENNQGFIDRADIAREFEDAVVDVLVKKTSEAIEETGAKTLIVAGGVISNSKLRASFIELEKTFPSLVVKIPTNKLSTDNAVMIACAGYFNVLENPDITKDKVDIKAVGNLRLTSK